MKPRHQVSRAALELIKSFEGYRRNAAQLPDGRWTVGYGHTKTAREGAEVSEQDAEALLVYDLLEINAAVNAWTYTPLTQNQFDALACFAFNIGLDNFRRSSVLRRVNEGAMLQAACAFEMWRKADFEGERIVIDALVRRRAAEKTLFLTPAHGWVPAPSPVVRPRVDYDVASAQPKQRPMNLVVAMDGAAAEAHEEKPAVVPVEPVDEEPSASQAAAEAVTARLQALMPDADFAENSAEAASGLDLPSPPAIAETPEPVAASAEVFTLTPPPEEPETPIEVQAEVLGAPAEPAPPQPLLFAPAPVVMAGPAAAAPNAYDAPPAPVMANADLARRAVRREEPAVSLSEFDTAPSKPLAANLGPLIGLCVLGIFLVGGGVVWANQVADQSLAAWAVSLFGVLLTFGSIYFLVEKFGGQED